MMGRLKREEAATFYQFQLDEAVPKHHLGVTLNCHRVRKIVAALI
jgi:hypothetical protein